MDGLTLLRRAHDVGLRLEAAGDKLVIRGPKRAEPIVRLLAEHKAAVLAALADNGHDEAELLATSPWFDRFISPADGEPSLEQPCAARRGRVQELNGAFLHFCCRCGRFAAFGYGVRLRAGRLGRWYCGEHRPDAKPVVKYKRRNDGVGQDSLMVHQFVARLRGRAAGKSPAR